MIADKDAGASAFGVIGEVSIETILEEHAAEEGGTAQARVLEGEIRPDLERTTVETFRVRVGGYAVVDDGCVKKAFTPEARAGGTSAKFQAAGFLLGLIDSVFDAALARVVLGRTGREEDVVVDGPGTNVGAVKLNVGVYAFDFDVGVSLIEVESRCDVCVFARWKEKVYDTVRGVIANCEAFGVAVDVRGVKSAGEVNVKAFARIVAAAANV